MSPTTLRRTIRNFHWDGFWTKRRKEGDRPIVARRHGSR